MRVAKKLLQTIQPGQILSVQVGLSRTAVLVKTENGIRCGVAATLFNSDFEHQCQPAVRQAGHLHEMDYRELAALIDSSSFTEASIGLATINALLPIDLDWVVDLNAEDHLMQTCAGKNVAMIGHFPFADRLRSRVENLWVLELNPREGDLPAGDAPQVIPQADVVAITGTTMINKTFDGLVSLCRPDAEVIILGPSTPLSPILFDSGVGILSGTVITDVRAAFFGISQGASLSQLRRSGCARFVTMKKRNNNGK